MKNVQNTMTGWKSKFVGTKVGFALAAGLTGAVAQAADHSTAIAAAGTDGETNVGAAVVVVLAIAAVITGVGIVIKLLSR